MQSQEYYALIGVLVIVGGGLLISVVSFLYKYKKAVLENMRPMDELNKNIIELTASIKYLTEKLEAQEARVTKHGAEIDEVKVKVNDHETRIGNLEFKVKSYHDK